MNVLPALAISIMCVAAHSANVTPQATEQWQPVPPTIGAPVGEPPSDAVKLFDGTDSREWQTAQGKSVEWKVVDGALIVGPGSGDIQTRRAFGDMQLHLEYRVPDGFEKGQDRGNSGVFFMGLYELQILDSYDNHTYVNGQAASIYKQHAPLVNASRPPGQWQTYDVLFHAPRFVADGTVIPARMTVLHNGVLVQDHVALRGATVYRGEPSYTPHANQLPLSLQDHRSRVSFKNIWARPLPPPSHPD